MNNYDAGDTVYNKVSHTKYIIMGTNEDQLLVQDDEGTTFLMPDRWVYKKKETKMSDEIKVGDRVNTHGQSGLVIAMWQNKVWVLNDGNAGPLTWNRSEVRKKPEKHVRWVNVYPGTVASMLHMDKYQADSYAEAHRIACIRIEFTEGEGLE